MIPFAPSFYPVLIFLMLVFGLPFAIFWGFWFVRLKKSPTARQNYQQKHRIKDESFVQTPISSFKIVKAMARQQPLSTTVFVMWVLSAVLMIEFNLIMAKIEAESQAEEAKRTPTLTNETTLAGITMPAGTKLELLHKGAVGEEWVKPDYFEYATFPKPILWQGVEIVAMRRFLDTKQDNDFASCSEKYPENSDQCFDLSSYETTRILWTMVETTLAKPMHTGHFYCQGVVGWGIAPDETGNVPDIDASLPVENFVVSPKCRTLAKGNTVMSENGFLRIELPENAHAFTDRMMGDDPTEFWIVSSDEQIFHTNLFSVRNFNYTPTLHLESKKLRTLKAEILKNTPECPLPEKSYIEWNFEKPNVLQVFSDKRIEKCGQFDLEYLDKHPDPEYAEYLRQIYANK